MREIKFRAWDKEFKMMSKPMEVFKNGQSFFFFQGIGTRCPNHESSIIMQFTGLKDKNGVEIYEGDRVHVATRFPNDKYEYDSVVTVVMPKTEWWVVGKRGVGAEAEEVTWRINSDTDMSRYTVIGNIYDESNNSLDDKSNL